MKKALVSAILACAAQFSMPAHAETTECTVISSVPIVITIQGVYCLKGDLATAITSGSAIDIQTNNVTIDLNGWKLGDGAAGPTTLAKGISASGRKNITIRNGSIRQFHTGVSLTGSGSGHLLEDLKLDGNIAVGAHVAGDNTIVRDNQIINTGPSANPNGLRVDNGKRVWVTGNMIGGVTGTVTSKGIVLTEIKAADVSGNLVIEIDGNVQNYGIFATDTDALYRNNRILNNPVGNIGRGITAIQLSREDGSIGGCFDNIMTGYVYAVHDCLQEAGNLLY